MPTDKKKIQVYATDETITKFRILTAIKGQKSMSEYAGNLIEKAISDYEAQNGPIPVKQIIRGGATES